MKFNGEEIYQIAQGIWETAIGMRLERDSGASIGNRPRSIAASIQITGAWNGAILLDCPIEVARQAASVMFSTDKASVTVADLQDGIAELVNMIGGHFKALLPETCYLSMPAVVEGGDYSTRIPGSAVAGRVIFNCEGHPMSIVLLEKGQEQAAA